MSTAPRPTDVRIEAVEHRFEDFLYRTPIKFGGVALDRCTLLNVHCTVRTVAGASARGFGSMPLGNVWSFPSRVLSYADTLGAMKALAERVARILGDCRAAGHPIDLGRALEPAYLDAARDVTRACALAEPIPHLCTLVVASPFDAALHDAFGKVHGRSCYDTYGPEFMAHDLGHYLGPEFKGESLDRYVTKQPKPRLPLYHLVGALDPLTDADVRQRVGDGLPETLPEWIRYNGLTHLKIKLNGDDLAWDVGRVLGVDRVAAETQAARGVARWFYSLDFNERCPNVGYLLELLARVRERAPAGFERIQYVEQPTARDLRAVNSDQWSVISKDWATLSSLITDHCSLSTVPRPVVIDESLIDLESLHLAREMGYTGAALKACKGQGGSLLLAAAAQKMGLFLCVQDLTCPGASLIHSAGLAAHVPGVAAVEANARQYCPAANRPWEERFPGLFRVSDGSMETGLLTGAGLGAVPA